MTMFILFLTLFAHIKNQQPIAAHGVPNKVADETIPVQVSDIENSLVFHPISQDVSMKISENAQEILPPERETSKADILIRHELAEEKPQQASVTSTPAQAPLPPPQPKPASRPPETTRPLPQPQEEVISKIYDLSKVEIAQEKLERFASVELIPDKTMRIILTGDLLFPSGQDELTKQAIASLKKLTGILKQTPYMINVIGHTDDRPVSTSRFPSNWELSLSRASHVARFLIDNTGLPPTQFRVTGFSSYRPLRPNTSEENRKINRRVEIVLSKELPQVQPPTPDNLQ